MKNVNPQLSGSDRDAQIQRLLALKRYEQPDPYFETRNLAALREKLSHEAPGVTWADRWLGWINEGAVPAVRLVLLSCLLALLGVNLWLFSSTPEPPVSAPAVAEREPVRFESELVELTATNELLQPYNKPVIVFEFPSNQQPVAPMQMGPRSVPVRYDF